MTLPSSNSTIQPRLLNETSQTGPPSTNVTDYVTLGAGVSDISYNTTTIGWAEREFVKNDTAIGVTLLFVALELFTNLGILIIMWRQKNTQKHVTLVIACNFVNIAMAAMFNGTMRTALFFKSETWISNTYSPDLCIVMVMWPNYFMASILFCMPLLPAERLILLLYPTKSGFKMSARKFGPVLAVLYLLALALMVLPGTPALAGEKDNKENYQCTGRLNYGRNFGFIYGALSGIAVIATMLFSVAVISVVKRRLKYLGKTKRRQELVKQEVKATIIVTVVLFLATVPFAVALLLSMACGANIITGIETCTRIRAVAFQGCVTVQRLSYTALPIVFILVNPSLRLKICYNFRQRKDTAKVISLPSSTSATSQPAPRDQGSDDRTAYVENSDDVISVPIEEPSVLSHVYQEYQRQGLLNHDGPTLSQDSNGMMSVISERSEFESSTKSTTSGTASRKSSITNQKLAKNDGDGHEVNMNPS